LAEVNGSTKRPGGFESAIKKSQAFIKNLIARAPSANHGLLEFLQKTRSYNFGFLFAKISCR